ncbi:MAG: type IV pilin protein [Pseudomonadota bacterium]|nr:type IV pilin protein [Pseudomonadota bacterium]
MSNNHVDGFSLLELLVALALLGILTTLAWPSYRDSLTRARRTEARDTLLALQLAQEKFRGNCAFHAQALGAESVCGSDAASSTLKMPLTVLPEHYELSIRSGSASASAYTLVATPIGIQAADRGCAPLTLSVDAANPQGVRTPAACW